jgi:glyoxylase-like metal-dependent hydrolase (beta-lactamase superfamily II)
MNLEDHLGDIIRKARMMSGASAAVAARAARWTEAEMSGVETSGVIPRRPDFPALAAAIGLNARKLESVASGWLPREKNLPAWREFRMFTTAGAGITVNCYLAWDEVAREAALFDTGFDATPILGSIARHSLELRHVFITHSHHDHVEALPKIREAFPGVKLHSNSRNAPEDQRNRPGEVIRLGGLSVTHRETPGHAEDGVTYLIGNWPDNAPVAAIVGDAIFAGSIGRGNQSWELARAKVREEILTLPAETLICPGHGPLTTVGEELGNNPFFG